jgi:hypothetical protein
MLRLTPRRARTQTLSLPPLQEGSRPIQRIPATAETSNPASLRTLYILQGAYLFLLLSIFTIRGVGLRPDIIFLLLAVGFAWRGNRWPFIRDFAPFILLLLSYDAMRGFADDIGGSVHFNYPIAIDKALFFGHVPTAVLQNWLFHPGISDWYNYGADLLHVLHFVVPLFFAAIIWQHYRQHYWPFVIALLLTSYAAFVTFLLLPTAPPWLAGLRGDLPGVVLVHNGIPGLKSVYTTFSPNPVAAMPSLHAAYPWLFLLFAWRLWGWRASPIALYPAAVWFGVVYLGHHYVADLLGGVLYATAAYAIVCSPVGERMARAIRSLAPWRRGTHPASSGAPSAHALAPASSAESPAIDP